MPYDRKKLNHIGGSLSDLTRVWNYESSDDITGAGYFPREEGINEGDKVIKVDITRENGKITAREDTEYFMTINVSDKLVANELNPSSE